MTKNIRKWFRKFLKIEEDFARVNEALAVDRENIQNHISMSKTEHSVMGRRVETIGFDLNDLGTKFSKFADDTHIKTDDLERGRFENARKIDRIRDDLRGFKASRGATPPTPPKPPKIKRGRLVMDTGKLKKIGDTDMYEGIMFKWWKPAHDVNMYHIIATDGLGNLVEFQFVPNDKRFHVIKQLAPTESITFEVMDALTAERFIMAYLNANEFEVESAYNNFED